MSVWISDEKLLIFASLISPSKMILFEKKYQTFDTVFHHQMKHLFSVFPLVMKHCVSCLIYYLKALVHDSRREVVSSEVRGPATGYDRGHLSF